MLNAFPWRALFSSAPVLRYRDDSRWLHRSFIKRSLNIHRWNGTLCLSAPPVCTRVSGNTVMLTSRVSQPFPCLLDAYHEGRTHNRLWLCLGDFHPNPERSRRLPLLIAATLWLCQVIFELVLYSVSGARSVYSHAQLTPECWMRCHTVLSGSKAPTAKRLGR